MQAREGYSSSPVSPASAKRAWPHEFATHASQRGVHRYCLGAVMNGKERRPSGRGYRLSVHMSGTGISEALRDRDGHRHSRYCSGDCGGACPSPSLSIPPTLGPEQARFRFFDSMTVFLKNVGHRQPLLLILHESTCNGPTGPRCSSWQFLVRELREARLLIVGTYRDDTLDRQHPLTDVAGRAGA